MKFDDIRVITFGCYGTLIDWDWGVQQIQIQLLNEKGSAVDIEDFQSRWEDEQFQLLLQPWRPYREILRHSLKATFEYFGEPYVDSDGDRFVGSMTEWLPFLGAKATLNRLKTRYRLAVLSNSDNEVLAASLENLGVEFDWRISSEDLRVYKPQREFFEQAQARLGVGPGQILHVAHGMRYDMAPAQAMGWSTMWVNRRGEGLGHVRQPDHTVVDLHELSDLIPV